MDFKEEYQSLIKAIKGKALSRGVRLKNADIAAKLGYNKDYFATLVGKSGKVSPSHVNDLKMAFHDDLAGIAKPTPEDPQADERSLVKAILFEVANLKAKVDGISFDEAVKEIRKNTNLVKTLDIGI